MSNQNTATPERPPPAVKGDIVFLLSMGVIGGFYVAMILALLVADATFTSLNDFKNALSSPEIQYSIRLSLFTCTISAALSLLVAVPVTYLMSHYRFPGKAILDGILDIPIVLPPLVIGLSLLILFRAPWLGWLERHVTYEIPAVILAQFLVACAFAIRTLRVTFDQIDPRREQVALTLGCSRAQAFWRVVLPEARRGLIAALTIAWARALGEFGPILVFAGTTRFKTEVLASTVFLELTVGNIEAAVAVSLLMVIAAVLVLVIVRGYGQGISPWGRHQDP